MLQKLLATLGVGGATIETTITAPARQGGTLQGTIVVQGGSVPQEVRDVVLALRVPARRESGDHTITETLTVAHGQVPLRTTLEPGARHQAAFQLPIPFDCPLSLGPTHVTLATGLDVAGAVDAGDRDPVRVLPDATLGALIDACAALGFAHQPRSGEVSYQKRGWFGQVPLQELKFRPQGGAYRGVLDELEFVISRDGASVEALVEIDRRGGMLSEWLDVDETHARLRIPAGRAFGAHDLDAFIRARLGR